jgi:hypothetical protein
LANNLTRHLPRILIQKTVGIVMENPQLNNMRELLRKAKLLPKVVQPEQTIFSIGGRGHWENPTTEILAFFCDNNAAHGLGDLVLRSLFHCLDPKFHHVDYSLNKKPERELSRVIFNYFPKLISPTSKISL